MLRDAPLFLCPEQGGEFACGILLHRWENVSIDAKGDFDALKVFQICCSGILCRACLLGRGRTFSLGVSLRWALT